MANVLIEKETMSDIANAIREKLDNENTYLPSEMPDAIKSIMVGREFVTEPLNATSNGIYELPEGVDGFSEVIVDTENGGEYGLIKNLALAEDYSSTAKTIYNTTKTVIPTFDDNNKKIVSVNIDGTDIEIQYNDTNGLIKFGNLSINLISLLQRFLMKDCAFGGGLNTNDYTLYKGTTSGKIYYNGNTGATISYSEGKGLVINDTSSGSASDINIYLPIKRDEINKLTIKGYSRYINNNSYTGLSFSLTDNGTSVFSISKKPTVGVYTSFEYVLEPKVTADYIKINLCEVALKITDIIIE